MTIPIQPEFYRGIDAQNVNIGSQKADIDVQNVDIEKLKEEYQNALLYYSDSRISSSDPALFKTAS